MSKIIRLSKDSEMKIKEITKEYEKMNANSDGVIQIPTESKIIEGSLNLMLGMVKRPL